MLKKEVRQEVLQQLTKLSAQPELKEKAQEKLRERLFKSEEWQRASVIGITLSMNKELDTAPIIQRALLENKRVGIPVTFEKGRMIFCEYQLGDPLEETSFGVLEPVKQLDIPKKEIDLLLVPGVAFSTEGYRVGFGGGFYDRYLVDFKGTTCSLVFTVQLRDDWEPNQYDLPVNKLIIEREEEVDHDLSTTH